MARLPWVLDESKFLSTSEARRLLKAVARRAEKTRGKAAEVAARDYLIVHLGLSTGLRVSELAGLECGHLLVAGAMASLIVRRGKGGRPRSVRLTRAMKDHLAQYLRRKAEIGEPVSGDAPLLLSSVTRGHLTARAIQKAFKRCAAHAGLSPHYSIHSLRHTYACHLYKASGWNLRLVQKQLGHSRIATTQVYADVMEPDLRRALERLYR